MQGSTVSTDLSVAARKEVLRRLILRRDDHRKKAKTTSTVGRVIGHVGRGAQDQDSGTPYDDEIDGHIRWFLDQVDPLVNELRELEGMERFIFRVLDYALEEMRMHLQCSMRVDLECTSLNKLQVLYPFSATTTVVDTPSGGVDLELVLLNQSRGPSTHGMGTAQFADFIRSDTFKAGMARYFDTQRRGHTFVSVGEMGIFDPDA